jgi:mannose-6-phosphate isomerase
MTAYPLLFEPILMPKVWGGRALELLGKRLPPGEKIGEAWELADLPEGRSVIANGAWRGRTLADVLRTDRRAIMGDARLTPEGGFPLLVKYLDAAENLSVQVHPDEAYARANPGAHLKSEAWIVIRARPGAVIYKGLKPHVTREAFAAHLRDGRVIDDLLTVPVTPGDVHYLPSGTCHALGAGIVVAEVQTPSDTTFRVYDWERGRDAAPGTARPLHIEQALGCIRFGQPPVITRPAAGPLTAHGVETEALVTTDYFTIERQHSPAGATLPIVTAGGPVVWMLLSGRAEIRGGDWPIVTLEPGTTVLIPAGVSRAAVTLDRDTTLLRVSLPSPLKGMIA